jgi:hypothetical protein
MSDHENGLLSRLQGWASQTASSIQDRAREAVGEQIRRRITRHMEELSERLAEPENVEALQSSLRRFANLSYTLGFAFDPQARQLFEFLDWAESRWGRQRVLLAIQEHNPLTTDEFIEFFDQVLQNPTAEPDPAVVEAFETVGRRELLSLLVLLGYPEGEATVWDETEGPPPLDRLVEAFETSDAPFRFQDLGRRARGSASTGPPDSREAANRQQTHRTQEPDESLLGSQMRQLVRRSESAIGQTVSRMLDADVRFVTVSFVMAVQAYFTRLAIDTLPEVVANDRQTPDDTEQSDDSDVVDV